MKIPNFCKHKQGFTLIELLVVIAIIGIVTSAVVLAINPVQMMQKSRDAQRKSDLAALSKAVDIYLTNLARNHSPVFSGQSKFTTVQSTVKKSKSNLLQSNSDKQNGNFHTDTENSYTQLAGIPGGGTVTAIVVPGGGTNAQTQHSDGSVGCCSGTDSACPNPTVATNGGWLIPYNGGSCTPADLSSYIAKIPVDPTNSTTHQYVYKTNAGGSKYNLEATLEYTATTWEVGTDITL